MLSSLYIRIGLVAVSSIVAWHLYDEHQDMKEVIANLEQDLLVKELASKINLNTIDALEKSNKECNRVNDLIKSVTAEKEEKVVEYEGQLNELLEENDRLILNNKKEIDDIVIDSDYVRLLQRTTIEARGDN